MLHNNYGNGDNAGEGEKRGEKEGKKDEHRCPHCKDKVLSSARGLKIHLARHCLAARREQEEENGSGNDDEEVAAPRRPRNRVRNERPVDRQAPPIPHRMPSPPPPQRNFQLPPPAYPGNYHGGFMDAPPPGYRMMAQLPIYERNNFAAAVNPLPVPQQLFIPQRPPGMQPAPVRQPQLPQPPHVIRPAPQLPPHPAQPAEQFADGVTRMPDGRIGFTLDAARRQDLLDADGRTLLMPPDMGYIVDAPPNVPARPPARPAPPPPRVDQARDIHNQQGNPPEIIVMERRVPGPPRDVANRNKRPISDSCIAGARPTKSIKKEDGPCCSKTAALTGDDIPEVIECKICFDAVRDAIFQPCGHFACCMACAEKRLAEEGTCPYDNDRIVDVQKVYLV